MANTPVHPIKDPRTKKQHLSFDPLLHGFMNAYAYKDKVLMVLNHLSHYSTYGFSDLFSFSQKAQIS